MKKYLFLDRGIFNGRYMTNAKVELASIQKEGTVFFREDFFADPPRKWEVRYDNGYPMSMEPAFFWMRKSRIRTGAISW